MKVCTVTIHDCRVDTFRAGGSGGQNQNKRDTGVRITHEPSGAVGQARDERSQAQNKRLAFRRMAETPAMRRWLRVQAAKHAGQPSVDELVERQMRPGMIRTEVRVDGKWEELRAGEPG